MRTIRYYEVYPSRDLAEARRDYIARRYPTEGYGTSVTVSSHPQGWVFSGHRWSSCD